MYLDRLFGLICLIIVDVSFSQCTNNVEIQELYFIGDSHIARWDLSYYFPNYITHNEGISGSNIQYIEDCEKKYSNKNIVVMIGSNDIGLIGTKYTLDDYVKRYVRSIEQLHGRVVYVYSILPNNIIENDYIVDYSKIIPLLNSAIESELHNSKSNIIYLDVYNDMTQDGYLNPEYYSDGLHLNSNGYEILTKRIQEIL